MANGGAESRSHWVTYALGMTATSIFGTKGAGTVTKAGTTATKTGVANAGKKVSELDMSNLLPYAPQYQVATGGYVPFNVVDGKQLKDQLIWQAKTGLGSGNHIIKGKYKLKPNIKYTTNGYNYSTDNIGRIDNANGKLQLGQGKRNSTHQVKAGGEDRIKGDHGGHLIAHVFGGSGLVDNMVPMNGNLVNQGSYRKLEIEWKKAIEEGQEVYVNITPKYKGPSLRPTEFVVSYTIDGKSMKKRLRNP